MSGGGWEGGGVSGLGWKEGERRGGGGYESILKFSKYLKQWAGPPYDKQ